jgi:excisionase family DNA binding protein
VNDINYHLERGKSISIERFFAMGMGKTLREEVVDDFFKVNEFADAGGFQPATVRAWILRRKITVVRLGGRSIRIPKSELERLIKEGTVPARIQHDSRK